MYLTADRAFPLHWNSKAMKTRVGAKVFSKVLLILALMSAMQVAPPTSYNGDGGSSIGLGPKKAQALPDIDFQQLSGHITSIGNLWKNILQLRQQYQLIRNNFRQLSTLVGSITGWEGLDSFFGPIDQFVNETLDPIIAYSNLGVNTLEALSKEFNSMNTGNNADESSASQMEDQQKFSLETVKRFFTEPSAVNKRLSKLNDMAQSASDCIQQAQGNLQLKQCFSTLKAVTGKKVGAVTRALARQSALVAQDGISSRMAAQHRRKMAQLVEKENETGSRYFFRNEGVVFQGKFGRTTRFGYY